MVYASQTRRALWRDLPDDTDTTHATLKAGLPCQSRKRTMRQPGRIRLMTEEKMMDCNNCCNARCATGQMCPGFIAKPPPAPVVEPAPAEKSAEERLEKAGYSVDRAVAALRASRGEWQKSSQCGFDNPVPWLDQEIIRLRAGVDHWQQQLAARDAEIVRLKAIVDEAAVIIEDLNPLPTERIAADNWLQARLPRVRKPAKGRR